MNFHGFRWYPAQWQTGLATILAAVVAFNFMSQTTASYVSTAGVAAIGLVTAALVRPWDLPLISAALTATLTGIGAFGFGLTDDKIAALVAVIMYVAGYFLHDRVTPRAGSPILADPQLAALAPAPAQPLAPHP